VAAVLVVGGTGAVAVSAAAGPPLEPRTAEQLLVALQQAEVEGLSGTVVQTSDLGIPAMPGGTGGPLPGSDSSLGSLLSGTHTLKVWYAAPDKARLAVHGTFGQSDVIRNGNEVWLWSSKDNTASHRTLTPHERSQPTETPLESMTPEAAADKVLEAIEPTTEVSTNGTATVAGRSAYELLLRPKDERSLIREVRIAMDSEESIPLRVQVVGSTDKPAFEVAYSDVDFSQPDDAQFAVNPPPGATVTEVDPKSSHGEDGAPEPDAPEHDAPDADSADRPTVVGRGWTSVVVVKTGSLDGTDNEQLGQMLQALTPVKGTWGSGRQLAGPAFSLLVTDDGRVAVGAVKPELLYEAIDK
jgi:outer membrane lipoprotein-sorting protein